MTCTHCRKPIGRCESYDRVEKGVRLSDGTVIATDHNMHHDCSGEWWLLHHPGVLPKVYVRAA